MAKLRFQLGTWNKSATLNGKDLGTGFLVVELDNTVAIKNLFKTTFLFNLTDVKDAAQDGKDLTITTSAGDVIELRAKAIDLENLGRLINAATKAGAA